MDDTHATLANNNNNYEFVSVANKLTEPAPIRRPKLNPTTSTRDDDCGHDDANNNDTTLLMFLVRRPHHADLSVWAARAAPNRPHWQCI